MQLSVSLCGGEESSQLEIINSGCISMLVMIQPSEK